nr:MAG TPA: hypothetical protein [Microviridae sp.]
MGERHILYIEINTRVQSSQNTEVIRSLFMRPETTQNLKTLAHTLSHKERRIGKLKTMIVIKTHRTFPPKGRTTILLPPLPLVFFFLLIHRQTIFINHNQKQTLHLTRSRQKLNSKNRCTVSQSTNKTRKLRIRQIKTSLRQENRAETQKIRKFRGLKIQRINRIILRKGSLWIILAKGNQITSVRKRII